MDEQNFAVAIRSFFWPTVVLILAAYQNVPRIGVLYGAFKAFVICFALWLLALLQSENQVYRKLSQLRVAYPTRPNLLR